LQPPHVTLIARLSSGPSISPLFLLSVLAAKCRYPPIN
jgi:hypothetical protein